MSRSDMNIALVHDYLHEFGGAERVLLALSEIWPRAPIYTAFATRGSSAWERFKDKDIRTSWFQYLPYASKLSSPLRFLAPVVWNSIDFSEFDVVITSANWFITKGIRKGSRLTDSGQAKTIEICYCHTPPRYLYGYPTSIVWRKYWPVRMYGQLVSHFLRQYDYQAAQRVDYFVANSKNVAKRIEKFYRRESTVIYPPVDVDALPQHSGSSHFTRNVRDDKAGSNSVPVLSRRGLRDDYYLIVSRIVGGKGLELAVRAANQLSIPLKIVGKAAGWGSAGNRLHELAGDTVEFVGEVTDDELYRLYTYARAFLAIAEDEDFGITPVEAMAHGTPVIAYKGGGYLESVVAGKTGVFFEQYTVEGLMQAIRRFEKEESGFQTTIIRKYAQRFSKKRFQREMKAFVEESVKTIHN